MLSDSTVRDCLRRLVPLQEVAEETKDRLGEIKREARSDGLNLDALNALLPVIGKYPHDKGASVLNEVIRYAEAFGTEGLVARGNADAHASSNAEASAEVPQLPEATTPPPAGSGRRLVAFASLRLPTQVALAGFLTFGLIWLLN